LKTPPIYLTDPILILSLVDTAGEHAHTETLVKYVPMIEDAFTDTNHPLHKAISLRSSGVLHRLQGDYPQAEEKIEQALEIFKGLEAQYQIGRTYHELGQLELAKNNPSQAKEHFSDALIAFEKMRAAPAIERTQAALQKISEGNF
jgi:tetratricopeptide (TPR) repeat protein